VLTLANYATVLVTAVKASITLAHGAACAINIFTTVIIAKCSQLAGLSLLTLSFYPSPEWRVGCVTFLSNIKLGRTCPTCKLHANMVYNIES